MNDQTQLARQHRAQDLARRFPIDARRPFVIEFAGVPKAGKTSTITQLQSFLRRCDFKVEVVIERASVCPIRDKKHSTFNVWTACTTLAQILEKTQDPPRPNDPDVLILDRGLFDALCWLSMMERLQRLSPTDRRKMESFLLIDEWRQKISGVIVMTVDPEQAMIREQGLLPVDGNDRLGSIMNPEVLKQMVDTTRKRVEELQGSVGGFPILEVDTSQGTQAVTAERVADYVLDRIEEHIREDVFVLPRSEVTSCFGDGQVLPAEATTGLIDRFQQCNTYKAREDAERDPNYVQALPVVVVRNRRGQVLQLKRRERNSANPLHKRFVIWAGGHVRKEDAEFGDPIVSGALRELKEELRLSIEANQLHLLGAIFCEAGERTSKHAAIVYEWRATTDEVEITLSNAEFFERRGASQISSFKDIDVLVRDLASGKDDEPWSQLIIEHFLMESSTPLTNRLFR